ncbi:MAG: acyltransferase [Ramlibacter sp.]|nr:acyltransferase [Ramlibacter sp.]
MHKTLGDYFDSQFENHGCSDNFLYLRIFAASLVIHGHSFALAATGSGQRDFADSHLGYRYSGDIAVAMFFVISGFLVTGSLERRAHLRSFLLARAARLFPGLLVCLLFSALVLGPIVTTVPLAQYFHSDIPWKYIASNALMVENRWFLPGVFESNRYGAAVNGSLWTLPVEARMYLGLAVLWGAHALVRKAWVTLIVAAAMAWSYAYPGGASSSANAEAVRLAAFFAVGTGLYLSRRWVPLNTWVFAAMSVLTWRLHGTKFYELSFSACICYGVMWCAYIPRLHQLRWLGDISYGTYLYGWLVQQMLARSYPALPPLSMMALALPLTWFIAALSWRFVERPAADWAKSFQRKHWRRSAMVEDERLAATTR